MAKSKLIKPIKSVTVTKTDTVNNYIVSGLNINNYIVLSAYETSNIAGASVTLGVNTTTNEVMAFLWAVDNTPYRGAATITFYYTDKN